MGKKVVFDEGAGEDAEDIDLESFGKKKKKKKVREGLDSMDEVKEALPEPAADDEDKDNAEDGSSDPWTGSDRDYQYDELLQRVFGIMRDKNPEMVGGDRKKFVMRPPQVVRVGSKKP